VAGEDDASRFLPAQRDLDHLARAASGCTACPLHENATQTVFGQGPQTAVAMLVGEQPGDAEDLAGRPFVGPAGKLLDRALAAAGIAREAVYVTNAVKHFKWQPRGKRRIHGKPNAREIRACHPWLEAEIAAVRPKVIVCLGATAAQALLGGKVKITEQRGGFVQSALAPYVTATVHPSALLRIPDRDKRHAAFEAFVGDLEKVSELLQ